MKEIKFLKDIQFVKNFIRNDAKGTCKTCRAEAETGDVRIMHSK